VPGLGGLRAAEQLRAAGHAGPPSTVIGAEPPHAVQPAAAVEGAPRGTSSPTRRPCPGADADGPWPRCTSGWPFRRRASVAGRYLPAWACPSLAANLGAGPSLPWADGAHAALSTALVAAAPGPAPPAISACRGPAGPGRRAARAAHARRLRQALRARTARRAWPARPRPAVSSPGPHVAVVGGGFNRLRGGLHPRCPWACDGPPSSSPAGPADAPRPGASRSPRAVQRGARARRGITFVIGQSVIGYRRPGPGHRRHPLADGTDASGAPQPPAASRWAGAVLPRPAWWSRRSARSRIPSGWPGTALDLADGVLCDKHACPPVAGGRPGAPVDRGRRRSQVPQPRCSTTCPAGSSTGRCRPTHRPARAAATPGRRGWTAARLTRTRSGPLPYFLERPGMPRSTRRPARTPRLAVHHARRG